jgi:hypothetical protein
MKLILDLIYTSEENERAGQNCLKDNPEALIMDYQKIVSEIPNLHVFLLKIREVYPHDPSIAAIIWYRIWCAMKCEEIMGFYLMYCVLRSMPDINNRPYQIKHNPGRKVLAHCFKILDRLVCSSNIKPTAKTHT